MLNGFDDRVVRVVLAELRDGGFVCCAFFGSLHLCDHTASMGPWPNNQTACSASGKSPTDGRLPPAAQEQIAS